MQIVRLSILGISQMLSCSEHYSQHPSCISNWGANLYRGKFVNNLKPLWKKEENELCLVNNGGSIFLCFPTLVKNIIVTLVLRYSIPKQMRNADFIWKWYMNVCSVSIYPEATLTLSFLVWKRTSFVLFPQMCPCGSKNIIIIEFWNNCQRNWTFLKSCL